MNSIRYMQAHNPQPTPPNDAENRRLCWAARHAETAEERLAARNELVLRCQGLVTMCAQWFIGRCPRSFDELMSDGQIGLIRAVELYDFDRGFAFSTYATTAIRRAMDEGVRTHLRQNRKTMLLDELAAANLPDRETDRAVQITSERQMQIGRLMRVLTVRERQIITLYYRLDYGAEASLTDREMSRKFRVTHQRICQLRNKAIEKMAEAHRREVAG